MPNMVSGPDGYWSTELPVSRGQWKDIAHVALALLGVQIPDNRYEATVEMVRLRKAYADSDRTPPRGEERVLVRRQVAHARAAIHDADPVVVDLARAREARALVAAVPRETAEAIIYSEHQAREYRRALRAPRRRHGQQHRCGGCNAFMTNRLHECSNCGYAEGVGWAA